MELGWGQETHSLTRMWASAFQPDGGLDHQCSWAEQMHRATSSETAAHLLQIGWETDVQETARNVKCPVLIIHPEGDRVAPLDEGLLLASLIPNCRFVQLKSDNHMPLREEPAWLQLVEEVRRFLAEPAPETGGRNLLPVDVLTPRERAVLEGIAEGLDNAEIAASLGMSAKTVRNHITRVFDKIGVEHRYQAIVRARDAGLGRRAEVR